tara:strand:+ start:3963 stop:4211 length:249 start_codon:yes stop_codon:yes gene_type:complete
MKTLHNIWDLEQLTNHTLKEIAFELDYILYSECTMNYNPMTKADLVGSIHMTLLEEGKNDMTEMIDYLIELVKDGRLELTNH